MEPRKHIEWRFNIAPDAKPETIRGAFGWAQWLTNHPDMQEVFASDSFYVEVTVEATEFTAVDGSGSSTFTYAQVTKQWWSSEQHEPLSPQFNPWVALDQQKGA